MKKILLVAAFVCSIGSLFAQSAKTPVKNNDISFSEVTHSFGKIKQNIPASYTFNLKNNGSKPLIIEQATAQCGCTTPEYSKAPILKGKTSPIKVTYNAANAGPFTKTVTVKFLNVPEPTILTIEGEVLKSADSTPKKG